MRIQQNWKLSEIPEPTTKVITASGEVQTNEEETVHVKDLDFVTPSQLCYHCICAHFRSALESQAKTVFCTLAITSGCTDCPLRTLLTLVTELSYCSFH